MSNQPLLDHSPLVSSKIHFSLQVTMVGGHVVEFREDGEQIVALHTIP